MPKYISGRVKTTPVTGLTSDRYRYLSLADAEPNLGDPLVGPSSIGAKPITSGNKYQLFAVDGYPGERYWQQVQAQQLIPGSISVYEEGSLIGGLSSTTELDFRGTAITAEGLGGINPGYAVTITFAPPGNEKEIIFKESNDFATDATFTFDSSINLLAAGDRITVGAGGTVITTTASGFVGIGTTNPIGNLIATPGIGTETLDPTLHVEGNIKLTGTVIDRLGDPGQAGYILVKEVDAFGGLRWRAPEDVSFGGGGLYRQVQFKGSTGLLEGGSLFYYDEVNNFVGIGSTQPTVRLDVIGTSNFDGDVTIEQNLTVTQLATFNGNIDANGNLDVDGQTDLDVLNVSQLATFSGNIDANGNLDVDGQTDLDVLNVSQLATFSANLDINASVDIQNNLDVGGTLDVTGATDLASAGGITTTGGDLYVGNDLYVAGTFDINDLEAETGNFTVSLQTVDFRATGISTLGNVKVSGNTVDTTGGNLILQANAANNVQSIDVRNRIVLNNDTQSTAVDNGSFETTGGVGIAKNLNVGGEVSFTGDGSGVDVTLASAGGITTTGGDLYVGGDFYVNQDANFKNLTVETLNVSVAATIANLTLDNPGIAVTAILDEDNMISNRDDALATQQSIKAYVDTQVGNQDLDFSGDTGTGAVDLDTQVFDVSGVSGDTVTSASGQTLTIASDVTGVIAGTYGSATRVGIITVNDKGKITAASDVAIDVSQANVETANRLTTPREISFSEDVVAVAKTFDGSQNVGFALTLASVFGGGTYGGEGNKVLSLTVDDKGRITGITSVNIDFGLANVATADSLTNARLIEATGDITWGVSFKGHEDVSGIATLATVNGDVGTYGSGTQIPVITVDEKGRITGVGLSDVDGGGGAAQADQVLTQSASSGSYFLTFVDSNNASPGQYESLYTDSSLGYNKTVNLLTVTGDLEVTGDVTIGDSSSDTLLVYSRVGSSIIPGITNTYDLGQSASLRWNTVYAQTICADNYCGAVITGNADNVSIATTDGTEEPYNLVFVSCTSGNRPVYVDGNNGLQYYPTTCEMSLGSNLLICDNASVCVGDSKEFAMTYCVGNFAYDSLGVLGGNAGGNATDALNRYDVSGNRIASCGKAALFEETGTGPVLFRALGSGEGAFEFFSTDSNDPGDGSVVPDPEQWVSLLKMHGGKRGFRLFQKDANLEVVNITGAGVTVAGNIVPWVGQNPQPNGRLGTPPNNFASGCFNLGSPTNKWDTVYADNICATNLTGTISGAASQVSTGCTTGSGTYYPTFVNSNNTSPTAESVFTDGGLVYDPGTNTLNPTNLTVANCLTVVQNARICGDLTVGAASITLNGSTNTITLGSGGVCLSPTTSVLDDLQVNGILPRSGSTYNLGSSLTKWNTVFADTVCATNLIGNISGGATQINTQCTTTNGAYYLTFVDSNNSSPTAETLYTNSIIHCKTSSGSRNYFQVDNTCIKNYGSSNVIIGESTTGNCVTSSDNVLLGTAAGRYFTNGGNNVMIGLQAGGVTACNACRNVFLGSYAGQYAGCAPVGTPSGAVSNNIAIGYLSGCALCANNSIFLGTSAGKTGNHDASIVIGQCTASNSNYSSTKRYNIFLGHYAARTSCDNIEDSIVIGKNASLDLQSTLFRSNIVIGSNSARNVRGTPQSNIIIGNNAAYNSNLCNIGSCNLVMGLSSGRNNLVGNSNVFLGSYAGNCQGGSRNVFIGHQNGLCVNTGDCNTAIGSPISNIIFSGTTCRTIFIGPQSAAAAYVGASWTVCSDIRSKCVWGSVPHGREFLRGVNPIKFSFKDQDTNEIVDDNIRYGFSAQEIIALEGEEQVIARKNSYDDHYITHDYMLPVLVNAIKELDTENTNLKQRLIAVEQCLGISS